ncbi:MAG: protein-export chaperone SecB [Gammaproteobacteria bacterium]|nr:protein-export chaperone SecB [Gammaproteobacteria bacterium]MDA7972803.1 protein-export chaperone SecB [Gammaproteobacteria bacterium]
MADDKPNPQPQPAAAAGQQPRAAVEAKKVYLKDASFESPASPQVFAEGELKPQLDVRMSMTHQPIGPNFHEVVLSTTVTAKHGDKPLFLAEIQQAGIFEVRNMKEEETEAVLETACPHVLLPFARESLASIVSKGGFPQLLLSPINFQALYLQKKSKGADAPAANPGAAN